MVVIFIGIKERFRNLVVDVGNVPLKICLQIAAVATVTTLVFLQLRYKELLPSVGENSSIFYAKDAKDSFFT